MKLSAKLMVGLGVVAVLFAQEEPLFRGGINLVDVLAIVRDKKGAIVTDLQKTDFRLWEDGKEQEIRQVVRQSDLPLTIGMLVDVSGSVAQEIPEERRAGLQFFDQVLRPEDQAFVLGFAGRAVLLQDTTSDLEELEDGLYDLQSAMGAVPRQRPQMPRRIQMNQFPMPGGIPGAGGGRPRTPSPIPGGRDPVGDPQPPAGTVLYDAVFLAADEVLQPLDGRKVIILITDGADQGSQVSLKESLDATVKADTIIYGIYVQAGMMGGERDVLERYAEKTGGRVFELDSGRKMDKIFAQIEEELRSQYLISYSPKNDRFDGTYRQLEVKTVKKDYKVRARDGYYATRRDR